MYTSCAFALLVCLQCIHPVKCFFRLCDIFSSTIAQTTFNETHVDNLENWIDEMSEKLPPLTNFILPVSDITSYRSDMFFIECVSRVGKQHHYCT